MSNIDELKQLFSSIFSPHRNIKKIIANEWQALGTIADSIDAELACDLIKKRVEFIYQVNLLKFTDPVHVCGTLKDYRYFDSYKQALAAYPQACAEYNKAFSKYIPGNLVVNTEISFAENSNNKEFEIHCHAIMERADYEIYKSATMAWRQGKFKANKFFDTRVARKNENQDAKEYVNNVFTYLTKFSLLEGDSRIRRQGNRAVKALDNQSIMATEYIKTHFQYGIYINSVKIRDVWNKKKAVLYRKLCQMHNLFKQNMYFDKLKRILKIKKRLLTTRKYLEYEFEDYFLNLISAEVIRTQIDCPNTC